MKKKVFLITLLILIIAIVISLFFVFNIYSNEHIEDLKYDFGSIKYTKSDEGFFAADGCDDSKVKLHHIGNDNCYFHIVVAKVNNKCNAKEFTDSDNSVKKEKINNYTWNKTIYKANEFNDNIIYYTEYNKKLYYVLVSNKCNNDVKDVVKTFKFK